MCQDSGEVVDLTCPQLFKHFVFATDSEVSDEPKEVIEQRHEHFEMCFQSIFHQMQDLLRSVSDRSGKPLPKSKVVQECRTFEDMIANMAILTGGIRNDGYSKRKDALVEASFMQYIFTRSGCTNAGYFTDEYLMENGPELLIQWVERVKASRRG